MLFGHGMTPSYIIPGSKWIKKVVLKLSYVPCASLPANTARPTARPTNMAFLIISHLCFGEYSSFMVELE